MLRNISLLACLSASAGLLESLTSVTHCHLHFQKCSTVAKVDRLVRIQKNIWNSTNSKCNLLLSGREVRVKL